MSKEEIIKEIKKIIQVLDFSVGAGRELLKDLLERISQ